MPDDTLTPPPQSEDAAGQAADPTPLQATDGQSTQAPPPQSGDAATGQASEPVIPPPEPVSEAPAESTPPPQESATAQPETPAPTEAQVSVAEPVSEPAPIQQSNPQPQQSSSTPIVTALHGDIAKARAKIQETKHKKLDRVMARLTGKANGSTRSINSGQASSPRVTNDEVEKLLHVSDATATRYLQSLEKESKIKQVGVTGKAVFYEKS